ncbi:MAG: ATP phosphoribosyltransferase regulatory subunit, partial [Phycisphaerales bacterium JB065]
MASSSDSKSDSRSGARVDPRSIGSPKGTRDFYPEDLLRRRYITEVWRAVSIRHGFEEIDGPTFEHSELYAVKSGEGILGELFQAFSGKAEDEREQVRETGNAPFALRPEFTPTLARMYAARAKQLPKPVRWFCVPNFFRAEKPQRGRLREFMQWNVDVIG